MKTESQTLSCLLSLLLLLCPVVCEGGATAACGAPRPIREGALQLVGCRGDTGRDLGP